MISRKVVLNPEQQIVCSFKVSMVIQPDTATIWWNKGCRMVFQVNQKSKMIRVGKLGKDRTCGKALEIRYKSQVNTLRLVHYGRNGWLTK